MMLNENSVLSLLPDRPEDAHKGNFGKLLLLCGSRGFTGAAYLSAMGHCAAGQVWYFWACRRASMPLKQ